MRLFTGVLAGVAVLVTLGTSTPAQAYTVHRGDTLWSIAVHADGNGHDWARITDERGRHPDPFRLRVGELLTVPAPRMYPATGTEPTAGICDSPSGSMVTVVLYDDMSAVRCYEVRPGQHLRIVNEAARSARMTAPFLRGVTVAPGRSFTLTARFGRYLAPGDHRVGSSLWCCFGFDLFLPGAPPPPPIAAG